MTERDRQKADEVKKLVEIPAYFDHIIVPNMKFYYDDGVDFSRKPYCRCPIHSEDTPSFRYFDYSNSYYCYGCAAGGDIIALHRSFMKESSNEEVSFEEAVRFLYSRFIDGNDSVQLNTKIGGVNSEEQLSTNVELSRFFKYLGDTERRIRMYPNDVKSKLYKLMDELERLVKLNKVNATEAKETLKTELTKVDAQVREQIKKERFVRVPKIQPLNRV